MIEKMKELGFIPESRAIKLYKKADKTIAERYDRVTYLRETLPISLHIGTEPVYVESGRFLSLLPFIRTATATDNYLEVKLVNGAIYKLPYLDLTFDRPNLSDVEPSTLLRGQLDFSALRKTVLKNLVKPEMRCIYVDENGAVSCNFLQGTTDLGIRTQGVGDAVLLPPDMIDYVDDGQSATVFELGDYLFYVNEEGTKSIWAPKADFDAVPDGEEPWFVKIFALTQGVEESVFTPIPTGMEDALKRLMSFSDEVTFYANKAVAGDNFEPMAIPTAQGEVFTIEDVCSVVGTCSGVAFSSGILFLRKAGVTVLVSQKEDE